MKWLRRTIILCAILASFGTGVLISSLNNNGREEVHAREDATLAFRAVVNTYLSELSKGRNIESLLTGEALANYRQQKHLQTAFECELLYLSTLFRKGDIAVVQAKIWSNVKGQENVEDEFMVLFRKNGEWKIAQVSRDYPVWIMVEDDGTDGEIQSRGTVEEYFAAIEKGSWDTVMKLTGGKVKEYLRQTRTYLPRRWNVSLEGLRMEKLAGNNSMEWILVDYTANNGMGKPQNIKQLFILEKGKNRWLVTHQIMLEQEEKGR